MPTDKEFQKQLADLYFHQGKYKKSQSLLRKILTDDPEDHYALWQMGEIAVAEGNMEDAYVYLHQAYNSCDDNPKYCFSLAQWYYDQ
ncbi:MAG: tetratricopeptide repeat protein [bacterium]